MLFAITDVETTGGHPSGHAMTEISIVLHDGKEIIDHFQTLLNPGIGIPFYITELTGISNEMVAEAPYFEEVCDEILDFLGDSVFVAHNVNFDYSFIKESFYREGISWNSKKLCTVRLSRKIFPGLRSYSLGNLCKHFELINPAAHRAWGDTEVTAKIFSLLLQNDHGGLIEKTLKRGDINAILPPSLPKEDYLALPDSPGVYYFYDKKGKIIYVGKAKRIKQRVHSHLTGKFLNRQRQDLAKELAAISFQETGTELIALLLEDQEIKKYWPRLNSAQKMQTGRFAVYHYEDRKGRFRFAVQKNQPGLKALRKFDSQRSAREWMLSFATKHDIPLQACGIENGIEAPKGWNTKFKKALAKLNKESEDFIIPGMGRNAEEQSFVRVANSQPVSFGFIPKDFAMYDVEQLEPFEVNIKPNGYAASVLQAFVDKGALVVPLKK